MYDPKRLGRVMWSREGPLGEMAPHDLHGLLTARNKDHFQNLQYILTDNRRIELALRFIAGAQWDDWELVAPYLEATLSPRSGARDMIMTGEWDPFWTSCNQSGVHSGTDVVE